MKRFMAGLLMACGIASISSMALAAESSIGLDVKTGYLSRITKGTASDAKENGFVGGVGVKTEYSPIQALNLTLKGDGYMSAMDARGAVDHSSKNVNYGIIKMEGLAGPKFEAKSRSEDFDGLFVFKPYVGAGYFSMFNLGSDSKTTFAGEFRQTYAKAGASMTYNYAKSSTLGLDKLYFDAGIKRQIDGKTRSNLAEDGNIVSLKNGNNRYSFAGEAGVAVGRYKIGASYEEFNADAGAKMGSVTNKLASLNVGLSF